MGIEENKETFRRVIDGINNCDLAVFNDLLANDYVAHFASGTELKGVEEYKEFVASAAKAFPDFHFIVKEILNEGDVLASRLLATATHKGEIMGIAPTGKSYSWEEGVFTRFEDGKIVEEWQYSTQPGLFEQMKQNITN